MNAAINASHASNASSVSSRRVRRPLQKASFWTLLLVLAALFASRAAYATTYTVTDNTDNTSDTGSLRYAVNNATSGSDTIDLSHVAGTITLTNGTLTINNSVTIIGPGAALLTISGNNATTVFTIGFNATVSIGKLNIAYGSGPINGGAIVNDGTLTLTQCAFSGNTAVLSGGAVYSMGALTVSDSIFAGNTATSGGGGAIYGVSMTVESSTFSGNTSTAGGAVFAQNATFENSTFFGNNVNGGGPGGGVFDNGTLTVNNSTITGNAPDGIWDNGGQPMTVTNSIVAGNNGADCDNCGTQSANNMIGGNAELGPLQFNGGRTETMMPLPGSPAIGAGSGSTLATDQRGFARSTSGASDLGAVQTNYLTVNTVNDSTDTTTCTGGATCSLRDAITLADTAGSGDIVFQSGLSGDIVLASALPTLNGNVNIAGPGANLLTIAGPGVSNTYSVLDIPNANAVVNLSGLTITNAGPNSPNGAGISNEGLLLIENCAFRLNIGTEGGAIFNDAGGSVQVANSTFSQDDAEDGGGILNLGALVVANGTFNDDRDYNGNGGGIANSGASALALVENSTLFGNNALNGGVGAGIYNSGAIALYNNILADNVNLNGNTEDDCSGCGTLDPSNQIGGTPNLSALAYNGLNATVQTMLPLPGSPAIQAGVLTLLPTELTTDERGFPRTTGGKLDVGAAQTNYTAVQFVQQPTATAINATINPAVTVEVLETNTNLAAPNNTDAVNGISIPLTFSGTGTLGGTLTQTTSGGVASFGDLSVNTIGTGNTLATSVTVTPTGVTPPVILTATSNPFDITLITQTITFTPPPANVTFGVTPITLVATSSASLPVTLQVDYGPATISGNILTITGGGTVVVEADAAAAGNYAAAAPVTETIVVAPAASSLVLTASANSAPTGTSVTLTASASSATPGTTAAPAGTVTFMANGNSIGTAQMTAGEATLAVTTLPAGSNTITASYGGDADFTGSTAQLAGAIVVGAPTFTMTSSASSLSISPGQTGTVTLTLTPSFGYTGTVNFSCGNLPLHSTCSFTPSSATFSGTTPVTVTLTVATSVKGQARSSIARLTPLHPLHSLPILPAIFFWLPGSRLALEEDEQNKQPRMKKKSFRMLLAALLLVLGVGMLSLTGCGGMSDKTPAGSQTVTITATGSGGVSQSISVQLNVS